MAPLRTLLPTMVLALALLPALAAAGQEEWMLEGFTARYVGSGFLTASASYGWLELEATVLAADASSVTLGFRGSGLEDDAAWVETYDRATRARDDGRAHAFLWVNEDDVARGHAWIGRELAWHVQTTPLHHRFVHGNAYHSFDVQTGLLVRVDDLDAPAALVRTG